MGGGSELSDQLLDPDVPTLASQNKLKVSPKGLPFVTCCTSILHLTRAQLASIVYRSKNGNYTQQVKSSLTTCNLYEQLVEPNPH